MKKTEQPGTPFQQKVWKELCKIPYGQTRTYEDIAKKIGKPKAIRAVANAIGANTLAVTVPCHRVIRKDGSLGGYRWGIAKKKKLLEMEKKGKK
jgi:AraC family transcriptional regulator of adaptative response/methylated-DNA-[protein]-cysteine methyltransferase